MSLALVLMAELGFVSDPAYSSEVSKGLAVCPTPQTEAKRCSDTRTQGMIQVELFVTIPADRLTFRHELKLDAGTTASGAAKAAYKIEQGLVCCDSRDVKTINGLAMDPHKEKWWVVLINGNMQNSSPRTILKDGDKVEWRYDEKKGYTPAHVRLEDWVENIKD